MKRLVFITILLGITLMLNAQHLKMSTNATEEEKAFFSTRDSLFTAFELNEVPTGFLKEFGVFFEDPLQYSGKSPDTSLNSSRLGYLLAGIRSATVNSKAINIPFYRDPLPLVCNEG